MALHQPGELTEKIWMDLAQLELIGLTVLGTCWRLGKNLRHGRYTQWLLGSSGVGSVGSVGSPLVWSFRHWNRLCIPCCILICAYIDPHKYHQIHTKMRYITNYLDMFTIFPSFFLVHMALFPLFPLFQGNPRRRQWTTRPSASWSRTVGRGRVEKIERSRHLKHSETQRNTI